MINFIVVDDYKQITDEIKSIINKVMMKNKLEYKIYIFNDYNEDFYKIMSNKLSNKIYLLDIETKSESGIDVARKIRSDDLDSVLIFITAHEELGGTIIRDQLMALTFICKFDDFKNKVASSITKSLEYMGKKQMIKIVDNNAIFIIPLKDILYITHDNIERKCIIKTTDRIYKVGKTLAELKELSQNSLVQSHRCCLVNENRILKFDKKKREITFDNNETIDIVSENYKKEVDKRC